MIVRSFRFDRPRIREFVRFGESLDRNDIRRIPPFRRSLAEALSPDYPFYGKTGNDHRHFLACRDGRTVGRVSAMVNAALKDDDQTPIGLVGLYECVEDDDVAAALLDAARKWLDAEHGLRRIWGPVNFDIWNGYRFLTGGFDRKPFYGEPDNKPYYPGQFERAGFVRRRTWDSIEVIGRANLEALAAGGRERYESLIGQGYRFVPAAAIDPRSDMRKLHDLISRTFDGFLGYTPIPFEEFERLFGRLRLIVARPMSVYVYDNKDRLVGYSLTFYELSAAVRAMNGRVNPLSAAKFLYHRARARRLNFFAAGVVPEERARGTGIGKAGLYFVVNQALQHGFEDMIFALMARGNPVQRLFSRTTPDARREYALYEWNA